MNRVLKTLHGLKYRRKDLFKGVFPVAALLLLALFAYLTFKQREDPLLREALGNPMANESTQNLKDPEQPQTPDLSSRPGSIEPGPENALTEAQKALPQRKKDAAILKAIAKQPNAPKMIDPEMGKFLLRQVKQQGVAPEDVTFNLKPQRPPEQPTKPRQRWANRQRLRSSPAPQIPGEPEMKTYAATGVPGFRKRRLAAKKSVFPIGQRLPAKLRTDVLASSQGLTHALIEVFSPAGQSLGFSLVSISARRIKDFLFLEGNRIIDPSNHTLSGSFVALSPNGIEGLQAKKKTRWVKHIGLTLFRTTLGLIPLRLAERSGNNIAGIIGAQTGSAIVGDLAGQIGNQPESFSALPRGYQFQIMFTSPVIIPELWQAELKNDPERFTKAATENWGTARAKEKAIADLSSYFKDLDGQRSPLNKNLSLENALTNPLGLLNAVEGQSP